MKKITLSFENTVVIEEITVKTFFYKGVTTKKRQKQLV